MNEDRQHQVFVSCESPGKALLSAVVEMVIARIETHGARCWSKHRDLRAVSGSAEAEDEIIEAIARSEVFVPVSYRKDDGAGEAIQGQIDQALERGIPIVPFRLRDDRSAGTGAGDEGDGGGNWLDHLDEMLDVRLDALAAKVESLLAGLEEYREAGAAGAELVEESEEGDLAGVLEEEEPPVEEDAGNTRESVLPEKSTVHPVIGPEKVLGEISGQAQGETVSFRGEGSEGEATEDLRESSSDERVTFPLPEPRVSLREQKRKRRNREDSEDGGGELEEAEEEEGSSEGRSRRRHSRVEIGEQDVLRKAAEDAEFPEPKEGVEDRSAILRWAPWICGLLIAGSVFLGIMKGSALNPQAASGERLSGLELLGLSLILYAADHDGRLPEDLAALKTFERQKGGAAGFTELDREAYWQIVYFPGHSWEDDPSSVVAASEVVREGKRAVLHLNGTVEEIAEEEYQENRGSRGTSTGAEF